jgi:hypothetical protein
MWADEIGTGPPGGEMGETIYIDEAKQIAGQRLWRAVIASTVQEWIHGPLRRQREAEEFLFHDDSDYQTVCHQAGLDPANLRSRLQKVRSSTNAKQFPRAPHRLSYC